MPEVAVQQEKKLDLLDTSKSPALSATSDIPVIETKPDASNEGKPPETKAAPETKVEDKTPPESATGPDDETPASDEPAKKPAKGVQKRLDELTRQREEAERRAKAAEENLRLALERKPAEPAKPQEEPAKPVQDEDPEPQRPLRANFQDPDAYDAAMLDYADKKAEHTARKAVREDRVLQDTERRKAAVAEHVRKVNETYNTRVEEAKKEYADFAEVAQADDVHITQFMADAIILHEQGPKIQYFLGKNKAEAKRISELSPQAQLIELGVIAASLRAAPAKAEPQPPVAEVKPKPISQAPKPIDPAPAGKAEVTKSVDEMSMDEYAAMRKPQLQAERRPGRR